MRGRDWLIAVPVAIAVMAIGVALTFGWVWIYSTMVNPGHDEPFYRAYAERVAPWIAVIAGIPIMFGAAWWLARSRTASAALEMGFALAALYVLFDMAILHAVGGLSGVFNIAMLSWASKSLAAMSGGWMGARRA